MDFIRKLPTPKEIKELYPLNENLKNIKEKNDEEIKKIFLGESDKLLLIIGPCSSDNEESVIDYISRLRTIQEKVKDEIVIIPRLYTNKPRTKGTGYKGMLHQPDPLKEEDMLKGLIAIRKLHMRAIEETGFSCADEMLYTENHRYLSDLLSYTAVGARSSEDQQHRLTASGLDIPVGMKNPMSGDLTSMLNSISAAQHPHTFIYRGWEVKSKGNPLAHAILRGYVNKEGESTPNYHYEDLVNLEKLYTNDNYQNPSIIVDTNHSNSNKNYLEQINIALDVISSMNKNDKLKKIIKGLMIESYIEDGCQNIDGGVYGKSITDPCLGIEKTEKLILDIYNLRKVNR
jgi:3-deoxy-7-phosphoheptulonate synthase